MVHQSHPRATLLKCSGIDGGAAAIRGRSSDGPGPAFMIFRGVIGFAPGPLQYKYPLDGASMKGRPEA
jgi:hypothetical protein